jgi:hypothetical protein
MELEDSYEGALQRMQRLEAAKLFDDVPARERELEELATLACEDNDRLKAELATAVSELDGVRAALDATRREAESAYQENEQLRASVASLQQQLAGAQQAQASAQRASVWPPQPQPAQVVAPVQAEPAQEYAAPTQVQPAAVWQQQTEAAQDDEYLDYPPKPSRMPLVIIGGAVALAIGLFALHPWSSGHSLPVAALPAAPAPIEVKAPTPPPVVTAPAPVVATTVPTVAPTIPKMAPPVAAPARVTRSRAAAHKKAKHHAAGKHSGKAKGAAAPVDDPLGGTDL